MISVKFADILVSKVLSGEKTKTWRLWDDKDLKSEDVVLFVKGDQREPFAKARLTKVLSKKFGEIDEEDRLGHESYEADLYQVYSDYYGREVTPDTPIKIISFELLD